MGKANYLLSRLSLEHVITKYVALNCVHWIDFRDYIVTLDILRETKALPSKSTWQAISLLGILRINQ